MTSSILPVRAISALALAAAALTVATNAAAAPGASFADVLKTPASASPLAQRTLINGLARAGKRLVAAGQRGHILFSDNDGQSWTQAKVPVSSDLTAICFPSATHGWAVGHDGVVLHSADAGVTWTLQLDGAAAAQAVLAHGTARGADESVLAEARQLVQQGPDKPFLDVWFEDEARGFVVGAFGLAFQTIDSGKTWMPAQGLLDNSRGLHLNAIRPAGGATYIVGEQGMVLRRAPGAERFVQVPMPYKGSFFGVAGNDAAVIVHGLRGNAFRSADKGATWHKVETGVQTGLTAAAVGGARFMLLSQAGQVLASADNGATFAPLPGMKPGPVSAALLIDRDAATAALLLGGARGLRVQPLQPLK